MYLSWKLLSHLIYRLIGFYIFSIQQSAIIMWISKYLLMDINVWPIYHPSYDCSIFWAMKNFMVQTIYLNRKVVSVQWSKNDRAATFFDQEIFLWSNTFYRNYKWLFGLINYRKLGIMFWSNKKKSYEYFLFFNHVNLHSRNEIVG